MGGRCARWLRSTARAVRVWGVSSGSDGGESVIAERVNREALRSPVWGLSNDQRAWLAKYRVRCEKYGDLTRYDVMVDLLGWLAERGAPGTAGSCRRGYEDAAPVYAWAEIMIPGFVKRSVPLPRLRALVTHTLASPELRTASALHMPGVDIDALRPGDRLRYVWRHGDRPAAPLPDRGPAARAAIEAVRHYVRARRAATDEELAAGVGWSELETAARACRTAAEAWGLSGAVPIDRDRRKAWEAGDTERLRVIGRRDAWIDAVLDALEESEHRQAAADATRQHPDALARLVVADVMGISEGTLNTLPAT